MRILVAEDNAASRVMLTRLLARCGHDVVAVADGTEALARLEAPGSPRLAILDRQMPGLDGTEVCRRLRAKTDSGRSHHLVLLTALGSKEDVILGLESGANDYLTKPIDARELKARLVAWERTLGPDPSSTVAEPLAISGGDDDVDGEMPTQLETPSPPGPGRRASIAPSARASIAPSARASIAQSARDSIAQSARASADLVGTTVAGKYEILEKLGTGGVGVVYKARHALLDETVALKVLHDAIADRPEVRERFLREAKAAMKFTHPNAIPVRDFGFAENGAPFMTLAYSSGRSLRALLSEVKKFPVGRAIGIVRQCLLAVVEAHAHGIVHRDLKPENILVETGLHGEDFPRICDFGMAKIAVASAEDDHMTGQNVIGTPHYMAPEQAVGDVVDHRVDLYAMGCVLYELVTGTRVFTAESAGQILMKQVTLRPERPSLRAAGIPERLDKLILRALEKSPDARPQSAADFIEALDEVSAPPHRLTRPVRVLLAEDNVVNQKLTSRMLEKRGYEVTVASDGVEALAALESASFDVVLMDGEMPRMDGFAATAEIRDRDRKAGRHTPIVAVMGSNRDADRQWCLAAGMDEHVAKPTEAGALFEAISKVLRTSRARESRSETQRRESRRFDASMALDRVEGDRELFREVASLFLSESVRLVARVRDALAQERASDVQRAAHELRGIAANCSANVVAKLAEELESHAAHRDLVRARVLAGELALEVEQVHPAILASAQAGAAP